MRRLYLHLVMLAVFLVPAYAQQTPNRFIIFTGYSHLMSPGIGLSQDGFNATVGVNANRWLGLGSDFGILTGSTNLGFGNTTLGSTVAPLVPSTLLPTITGLSAPISATTFTWAVGPKLNLRKWKRFSLFAHPGLGLIHESIDINLTPVNNLLGSAALAPYLATASGAALVKSLQSTLKPNITDTVPFFGAGVGADVYINRYVGLRFSTDWIHSHLFSSILSSQDSVRLSVGPMWGVGEITRTRK